jgi:hypothetical protein
MIAERPIDLPTPTGRVLCDAATPERVHEPVPVDRCSFADFVLGRPGNEPVTHRQNSLTAVLHREHAALVARIARLEHRQPAEELRALWDELLVDLAAHADAGREVVFEPLASGVAVREKAMSAISDLADLLVLLEDMDGLRPSSPRFRACRVKLSRRMDRHRVDVEGTLLPLAAATFGPRMLHGMGKEFLAKKRQLVEQLSR